MNLDRWTPLDFTAKPAPPDYLVRGLVARGWITVFHGPPGACKSFAWQALIGAALNGRAFCEIPVTGVERVLVLDEENPVDVAQSRMAAFGGEAVTDRARLRYFSRLGVRLGQGTWAAELLELVGRFRPDLVVIDSVSRATATAVNENDQISAAFAEIFGAIVGHGCGLILVHHDRKAPREGSDPAESRMLGGMQWYGQVDREVAFERRDAHVNRWAAPNGNERQSYRCRLVPGKLRSGVDLDPFTFTVESETTPDDQLVWMRLDREPEPEPERAVTSGNAPTGADLARVREWLAGQPHPEVGRAEIEAAFPTLTGGRLNRILAQLPRARRGWYRAGEQAAPPLSEPEAGPERECPSGL